VLIYTVLMHKCTAFNWMRLQSWYNQTGLKVYAINLTTVKRRPCTWREWLGGRWAVMPRGCCCCCCWESKIQIRLRTRSPGVQFSRVTAILYHSVLHTAKSVCVVCRQLGSSRLDWLYLHHTLSLRSVVSLANHSTEAKQ